MRRLFWVAVGAGAGVWATRKATKVARQLTPQSLAGKAAGRAVGAGDRLRLFAQDVRLEMREREEQLREAIALDQAPAQDPAATPATAAGAERAPRVLKARYTVIDDDDKDGH